MPGCSGWQKPAARVLPGRCSLAALMVSFTVITLITLSSLGINENIVWAWRGIFIVVQH